MIGGAAVRRLAARLQGPENRAMPKLEPDQVYQLLRQLTSPVVAITCQRDGKRNGMISDSAVRASIAPTVPRLSVYIHKFNFSHDLIFETGRFVLHLLRTDQFELIHRLGFVSGRARDKLAGIAHRPGTLGVPVLDDCYAHFECRVANVMDTGSSTCFLGDVVAGGHGAAARPAAEARTAGYFGANMPRGGLPKHRTGRWACKSLLRASEAAFVAPSRVKPPPPRPPAPRTELCRGSLAGYGSTTSIVCPDLSGPATLWCRPDGHSTSIDPAWSASARPK